MIDHTEAVFVLVPGVPPRRALSLVNAQSFLMKDMVQHIYTSPAQLYAGGRELANQALRAFMLQEYKDWDEVCVHDAWEVLCEAMRPANVWFGSQHTPEAQLSNEATKAAGAYSYDTRAVLSKGFRHGPYRMAENAKELVVGEWKQRVQLVDLLLTAFGHETFKETQAIGLIQMNMTKGVIKTRSKTTASQVWSWHVPPMAKINVLKPGR